METMFTLFDLLRIEVRLYCAISKKILHQNVNIYDLLLFSAVIKLKLGYSSDARIKWCTMKYTESTVKGEVMDKETPYLSSRHTGKKKAGTWNWKQTE